MPFQIGLFEIAVLAVLAVAAVLVIGRLMRR
jgi:hypothetical protein